MFTIITNYKKLFLLTLRSEFGAGGENMEWDAWKAQESRDNSNNLSTELKEVFEKFKNEDPKYKELKKELEKNKWIVINENWRQLKDEKNFYKNFYKSDRVTIKLIQEKLWVNADWIMWPETVKAIRALQKALWFSTQDWKIWKDTLEALKLRFKKEDEKESSEIKIKSVIADNEKGLNEKIDWMKKIIWDYLKDNKYEDVDLSKLSDDNVKKINETITKIQSKQKDEKVLIDEFKKLGINLEKALIEEEIVGKEKDEIIEKNYNEKKPVETSKDTISKLEEEYNGKIDKLDKLVNDWNDYRYVMLPNSERIVRVPEKLLAWTKDPATIMNLAINYWNKRTEWTASLDNLMSGLEDILGNKKWVEKIIEINKILSNNWKKIISIDEINLSSEAKKVLARVFTLNMWDSAWKQNIDKENYSDEVSKKTKEDNKKSKEIAENNNLDAVAKKYLIELKKLWTYNLNFDNVSEIYEKIKNNNILKKVVLKIINKKDFTDENYITYLWIFKSKLQSNEKWVLKTIKEYLVESKKDAFIVRDWNYIFDENAVMQALEWSKIISWKIQYKDWKKKESKEEEIVHNVKEIKREELNEMLKWKVEFSENDIKKMDWTNVPLVWKEKWQLLIKDWKIIIVWEFQKEWFAENFMVDTKDVAKSETAKNIYIAAWASLLTAALIKWVDLSPLDPSRIKWSKIDPGKINWSEIDPTKLFKKLDISISDVTATWLLTYLTTSISLNMKIADLESQLDLLKWEKNAKMILKSKKIEINEDNNENIDINAISSLNNKFWDFNYDVIDSWNWNYIVKLKKNFKMKSWSYNIEFNNIVIDKNWNLISWIFDFNKRWFGSTPENMRNMKLKKWIEWFDLVNDLYNKIKDWKIEK